MEINRVTVFVLGVFLGASMMALSPNWKSKTSCYEKLETTHCRILFNEEK